MSNSSPTSPPGGSRSPAEIERDLEQTRERLAGNIDQLAERVHPKAVAKRSADMAKDKANDAAGKATVVAQDLAVKAKAAGLEGLEKVKAFAGLYSGKAQVVGRDSLQKARGELVDSSGNARPDRVAAAGAAVAAAAGLVIWRRRR